ncbi:Holliday junction branch migration protein RuvA [Flaviaesturariibacter aridisoli]|uniref:Holliday junction branch migration complex subunit RuvA n=1 Tax=Flaviaesturariibacter aridisoli TaxID=2545761 RepID=A0A4R4E851_9BACT|nr:Holliday junction branch migration protein RuvA [Flaviaesturariibacter aridisoli]TCZ75010.1 Holliday junction branch migration protein RuvA [Flaviaesturariibacter aridisoli]
MIAFLKGDFVHKTPASVYVDVAGVGYEVHISLHTYSAIQDLEKGTLYTHLLVREDAHILYGFAGEGERELFRMLLGVSGVGAATARVMLSYLKPDELGRAIANGDARQLERVKGIGRKTAERIVLELREKLVKNPVEGGGSAQNISSWKGNSLETDALNALVALGIARAAADAAVRKVVAQSPDLGVEEVIKKALQSL